MRSPIPWRMWNKLQISGRTSADAMAATHTDAVQAGQKLGVDAVVNGEIAEQPGGLRATIRLTAVKDARVLWSRVYDRQAADIFAAQSSIASAVARELMGFLKREEFSCAQFQLKIAGVARSGGLSAVSARRASGSAAG